MQWIERITKLIGLVLILLALLVNPIVIEQLFSAGRYIETGTKIAIVSLEFFIFIFGAYVYLNSQSLVEKLEGSIFFEKRRELLLFTVSLFLAFVVAEGTLRLVDPHLHEDDFLLRDSYLFWKINPSIHEASQGFQEHSINFDELEEDNLIYAIGDSFTYGVVGYKDNYITLIDNNLSEYDVVNLGVPAYGTDQYLRMVKKYSKIKKPKYIFLNLFVGNDFTDYAFTVVLVNGVPRPSYIGYMLRNSFVLRGIYQLYHEPPNRLTQRGNITGDTTFTEEEFLQIEKDRLIRVSRKTDDGHARGLSLVRRSLNNFVAKTSLNNLKKIQEYCEKNDIYLIVFILPDEYQVNEELRHKIYLRYDLQQDAMDIDKPQTVLKDFLDEEGIAYIDLLPYFKEASEDRTLYKLRDTHWNEEGNRLAAEVITSKLKESNLIELEN